MFKAMRHYLYKFMKKIPKVLAGRRGQSITETAVLLMVIVFAFIAMQTYLKRSLQGRLRQNIDSIGEQYDPAKTTSDYTMTHLANTTTITRTAEAEGVVIPVGGWGYYTSQNRVVTSIEMQTHYDNTYKNGYEYVGAP